LALAVTAWAVIPALEYRDELSKKIDLAVKRNARLEETATRLAAYANAPARDTQARPEDFSVFALLRELADHNGVKDQVTSFKPTVKELEGGRQEEIVAVRLERVPLDKLMDYLSAIENAPAGLRITQFACRADAQEGMNAALTVSGGAGRAAP